MKMFAALAAGAVTKTDKPPTEVKQDIIEHDDNVDGRFKSNKK